MVRLETVPPCHVAPAPGVQADHYSPWLTAALWLRVAVPAWRHEESAWTYWAVPASAPGAAPRPFDPGRFAAIPGEPESPAVQGTVQLGEVEARALVAAVLARWRPSLHRQPELDMHSRLDETRDEFRRRCLALLRPLLGTAPRDREAAAARLAAVAGGIESVAVDASGLDVRHARVGVVWYPSGREPALSAPELMTSGAARGGR